MRKEIDKQKLFERVLNTYISADFSRKSIYFDEELKKEFDYRRIVEYLENYFRRNVVEEEKILLYHNKRINIDSPYVNITKYQNEFYKFISGNYKSIKYTLNYIEKYADKNDLEKYKKALIRYYEKYQNEFENFENNNFIDNYSQQEHKKFPIMLLFHEYVKYILKENYVTYKRRKSLNNSKYYSILSKILESDNLYTLAQEICERNLASSLELSKTFDFTMIYKEVYKITDEEAKKIENILIKKIQQLRIYIKKITEIKKSEQNKIITEKYEMQRLDLCNKIVIEYLNSNSTSMKIFCKKNDILYDRFKTDVLIVKKYNPELYRKFADKVKRQQDQRCFILLDILNQIVDKLINGVKIDSETKREFDIIDYYLIINIHFDQLLSFAKKNLDGEELRLVRKFIKKYYYGREIIKRDILDERNIIIVKDQQYEVTQEDKNYIFSYLERNNIPFLASTYNIALKRYLNNDLPELQNSRKLKIKK